MRRGRPITCFCGVCRTCKKRESSRRLREAAPRKKPTLSPEAQERRRERRMARYYANKNQARAHDKVRKAILKGTLVRGECEIGGDCSGPIEAHHDDYDKPLDVRWVCMKHHFEIGHRERTAA